MGTIYDERKKLIDMNRKLENALCMLDKMNPGLKRDEIFDKFIELLKSKNALEDEFIRAFKDKCLYEDKICNNPNRGTYVCENCIEYLNNIFGTN